MMNIMNLTNIAYSNEYTEHKNNIIKTTYNENNIVKEYEKTEGGLKRTITEYSLKNDNKSYYCSNNKVYTNNKLVFEYFNLYHHDFFCEKIVYNNGKEYIFYKMDLYGYNVFQIDANETFDYYPKCSFGKFESETFIGTDIHFNNKNNVFAVGGCYWACPRDTLLIKIDNPLKQFSQYINIHLIMDNGYDKYDDIDFVEWENNNIKLKCYNVETEPYHYETITINEEEYTDKMIKI